MHHLKIKDQAFETFKEWKAMIMNQVGRRVKMLKIDNGIEYFSNAFDKFYKVRGIRR